MRIAFLLLLLLQGCGGAGQSAQNEQAPSESFDQQSQVDANSDSESTNGSLSDDELVSTSKQMNLTWDVISSSDANTMVRSRVYVPLNPTASRLSLYLDGELYAELDYINGQLFYDFELDPYYHTEGFGSYIDFGEFATVVLYDDSGAILSEDTFDIKIATFSVDSRINPVAYDGQALVDTRDYAGCPEIISDSPIAPEIRWNAQANVSKYRVLRYNESEGKETFVDLAADQVSYVPDNLAFGDYGFGIQSFDADGRPGRWECALSISYSEFPVPNGLSVDTSGGVLNWSNSELSDDIYAVEVATESGEIITESVGALSELEVEFGAMDFQWRAALADRYGNQGPWTDWEVSYGELFFTEMNLLSTEANPDVWFADDGPIDFAFDRDDVLLLSSKSDNGQFNWDGMMGESSNIAFDLRKIDIHGNIVWVRSFADTADSPRGLLVSDGEYFVFGHSRQTRLPMVMRVSASGEFVDLYEFEIESIQPEYRQWQSISAWVLAGNDIYLSLETVTFDDQASRAISKEIDAFKLSVVDGAMTAERLFEVPQTDSFNYGSFDSIVAEGDSVYFFGLVNAVRSEVDDFDYFMGPQKPSDQDGVYVYKYNTSDESIDTDERFGVRAQDITGVAAVEGGFKLAVDDIWGHDDGLLFDYSFKQKFEHQLYQVGGAPFYRPKMVTTPAGLVLYGGTSERWEDARFKRLGDDFLVGKLHSSPSIYVRSAKYHPTLGLVVLGTREDDYGDDGTTVLFNLSSGFSAADPVDITTETSF
ncbi:MAG: hypothetical protein HWE20_03190 [Gammaproteobacteria bacterium]|nr:hypothetical protein [Gammaproteobacteria bacterium]